MVDDVSHSGLSFRHVRHILVERLEESGRTTLSSEYILESTRETPSIHHVKTYLVDPALVTLGEEDDVWIESSEICKSVCPEILRNTFCIVAAETVDSCLSHPECHSVLHGLTHVCIAEVKVCHVSPVKAWRRDDVSCSIGRVPAFVLSPWVVPRRVVGNPVKDDLHTEVVSLVYEVLEVIKSTVLWMNLSEVLDTVWRADGLLLALLADRHKPDHVHSEVLDVLKTCGNRIKLVACSKNAWVSFIEYIGSIRLFIRVSDRFLLLGLL